MGEDGDIRSNGFRGRSPLLEALARKCEPHAIKHGISEDRTPAVLWLLLEPEIYGAHGLDIADGSRARLALEAPFELYRMLSSSGYRAMWSPELGAVECEVAPHGRWEDVSPRRKDWSARLTLDKLGLRSFPEGGLPEEERPRLSDFEDTKAHNEVWLSHFTRRREALDRDLSEKELDPATRVSLAAGDGVTVSVGPCSDAWVVWHDSAEDPGDGGDRTVVRRYLTLRVEGANVPDAARAVGVLERFGSAALFELDRAAEAGLQLVRVESTFWARMSRQSAGAAVVPTLPSRLDSEYDREPVSLYWYGRSAEEGMPLLAFLAHYQVLEFYFPRYSRRGAIQAVRDSLRGLSFDALRDADLAKVLDAVNINRKGFFGNEAEQLKATVRHCVGQEALRSFFEAEEDRERFYASDECKRVSPTRVPIGGSSADWRGDVARRVYEIRNRIVHAKSQHDDLDPLLPFDPEAALLWHDVELVAFLARETLSASAKPLGSKAAGTP